MKVLPEGKLAPIDPPLSVKSYHITSQHTVYTDGLATAENKNGGA